MERRGPESPQGSGGNRGGGGGGGKSSDKDKFDGGHGGSGTGAKPARKRRSKKEWMPLLDLKPADTQIGPRTPASDVPSSIPPKFNAAVEPFAPRSATAQASLSLPGTYATALKYPEPQIGSLTSAPRSTYTTTDIIQPSKTLGFGAVYSDSEQRTSQASASGELSASQSGGSGTKCPRSSLQYVAALKRLEEAKAKKETSQTSSKTAEAPSAIRDAFLAAAPVKSFLEFNKQTTDIILANSHTPQGAQAKELSEISSSTVFKANQELFNATRPFKRTKSPAFLQLNQVQPSISAPVSAATPSKSLIGPLVEPSVPTPGQVTFPVSSRTVLRPTSKASVPVPRRVTISTAATLPAQVQACYITPTRGSLAYRNLGSISGPRRPLHMHSQSFSQPHRSSFSASRPVPISFSASRLSNRLQFVTPTKSSTGTSQSLILDSPLDRPNDTEEQKKKIDSVMSSFREVGDSYDSIEWLPNEGEAGYGKSPKPLTVHPQPVASYTTVGSLKPAPNQHFTAPNRIQRDGTGRRPLQANLHGRGHENHFGGCNVSQQYNTGYGPSSNPQYGAMDYSQYGSVNQPPFGSSTQSHFGSMNQPQHDSTFQSRFGSPALPQHGNMSQLQCRAPTNSQYDPIHQRQSRPLTQCESENQTQYESSAQSGLASIHNLQRLNDPVSMALTDAEKNVLRANGLSGPLMGSSAPFMGSRNLPQNHHDMVQKTDPSLNPKAESFNLHGQLKDNESGQTKSIQKSLPKIGNMQDFSQHKNYTEQLAEVHLAEGTTSRTLHGALSTGANIAQQSTITGTISYRQTVNGGDDQGNTGHDTWSREHFDHNYRFPPPGLAHPTQASQSGGGYDQQTALGFSSYEQVTTNQQDQMHLGRSQPLTAGPPGQRQNAGFHATGISSTQGNQAGSSQLSSVQNPPALPLNSPWLTHSRNSMFTSVPTEHNKIRDTLPFDEIRQYYPNGFPKDMTGQYTRLSGPVDQSRPGMTEEEIKTEKTNRWFHAGVRRLNKTVNDHIADVERRNYNLDRGIHSQHPQHTGNLDEYGNPLTLSEFVAISEPLTVKDVVEMPLPEVAAHLLGPVFGNALILADQRPGPNNPSTLSRFAPAPPWAIDNSEQGNQSFFGEDWGTAPKRVGRDPRYQPYE